MRAGSLFLLCVLALCGGVQSQDSTKQWSEWSPCSRTCGVGVSYQKRVCLDITDSGGKTCPEEFNYRTCNIQDCPEGSGNFRYEQCAEFNNRTLDGRKYKWVPYIPGVDRCGLNCMPKGEYFYYKWGEKVVDGTRCGQDSYDICVNGECKSLGCDLILNSKAKEDKCRVCNGNGENCRTVRGSYYDIGEGYKEFLVIPPGATNLRIEEIKPSVHFIAMADSKGKFFFNGNYVVTNPRTYKFAGTLFRYERTEAGKEVISALGPTTEQVHVVGLMTADEPNPGIEYEFSLPKSVVVLPKKAKYSWKMDGFSACTASCAGGYQVRRVFCARDRDGKVVDDIFCDYKSKPQTRRQCNDSPCPPRWFISGWSACSSTCGQGKQVRRVHCEQVVSGGDTQMIPDDKCTGVGAKPSGTRLCTLTRYCPVWAAGAWSACSVSCGEGFTTREVVCRRVEKDNRETLSPIRDDYCDSRARPVDRQRCNEGPCTTKWLTSQWSECYPKCGRGISTRMVYCVSVTDESQKYPDTLCNNSTRPQNQKQCVSDRVCPPMWHASQWSRCTATCGTGMKMRNVVCAQDEGKILRVVPRDLCDRNHSMPSIAKCSTRPCQAGWYIFPWQPCTRSCGVGLKRRQIKCFADSKEDPEEKWCDQETKPHDVERCLVRYCDQEETDAPPPTWEPFTQAIETRAPTTTRQQTVLPTTVRPTTKRPTTTRPTTKRPTTEQPTTERPTTTLPTTKRPTTTRPTTTRPTTTRPTTKQPTTTRPTTTRPTTTRPTTTRPTTKRPTTIRPTTTRPTTKRPTTTRPTTTRPTTTRPATTRPTTILSTTFPVTSPKPTRRATLQTEKPKPIVPARIVEGPRDITTFVRSQVLLTCRAEGNPEPSVGWKKGLLPVSSLGPRYEILEDGTLRIEQAMIEDEGTYSCYATNFKGPLQTRTANLRVVVPVTVSMIPRDEHEVSVGEPLTIYCQFSGKPTPFNRWYKDSQLILNGNERISISPGQISIKSVLPSDAGLYECQAIHDYGRAADFVTIKVKGDQPSLAPTVEVCEDDESVAECSIVKRVNYCRHSFYQKACCKTCRGT